MEKINKIVNPFLENFKPHTAGIVSTLISTFWCLVTFDWRLGKLINLSKASSLAAGLVKYINNVRLALAPGKVAFNSDAKFAESEFAVRIFLLIWASKWRFSVTKFDHNEA